MIYRSSGGRLSATNHLEMPTRKRERPRAPESLGVHEFASALNGDDALLILEKLRHFVDVVGYERRLALSASADGDGSKVPSVPTAPDDEDDGVSASDGETSLCSSSSDAPPSSKRQRRGDETPSWQLDKNNYQVPFVGTSVSKGPTGTVVPNAWPTGFLEAYRQHSPTGVELTSNDYISSVPPGGIHKGLCNDSPFNLNVDSGGKKGGKKGGIDADRGGQTRGKIISMALQSKYWMALSEWILGFATLGTLEKELNWERGDIGAIEATTVETDIDKNDKCMVPPPIMTILVKQRLPEWIDAIHNYAQQKQRYSQQKQKESQQKKKQDQKKQQHQQSQTEGDHQRQQELQQAEDTKHEKKQRQLRKRQQREDDIFLSAVQNLIALCYLSNGTAREVLRILTTGPSAPSKRGAGSASKGNISVGPKANSGTREVALWMVQLFQHRLDVPSFNPQVECLRLVCTLLETKDYVVLSRISEAPRQGSNKGKGKGGNHSAGDVGLAYIALQYGIQRLLEVGKGQEKNLENEEERISDEGDNHIQSFAWCMARLLRNIRTIFLPSVSGEGNSNNGRNAEKDFLLGVDSTAKFFSGVVLINLSKLSLRAPFFDDTTESIRAIKNGIDEYDDLGPMELAALEARRLLFIILSDTHKSPFLHYIQCNATGEYSTQYLVQLSNVLHGVLANQVHGMSMKMFLGICLVTTRELVPHFLQGLQLPDPKPTYRSLAALTFVEGILLEAPPPDIHTSSTTDGIISAIIPRCITKTLLGKLVQSSSALFASSGLKLIIILARRAYSYIAKSVVHIEGNNTKSSVIEAMSRHFPEATLLLSIPSRFYPFEVDGAKSSPCASTIVMLQLFEALRCYVQLDPSFMKNVKFDWARLVPCHPPSQDIDQLHSRSFFSADPVLQHRILQTLLVVAHSSQSNLLPKLLSNVLTVLVSTSIPEVYSVARQLALLLIGREIDSQSNADSPIESNEHESSLWIDGIMASNIQELMMMMDDCKQQRIHYKISISQAWADAAMRHDMPPLGVSSLLLSSICQLLAEEGSYSNEMTTLITQIATDMLLQASDPKPFATVIALFNHGKKPRGKQVLGLYNVAKSIFDDDPKTGASIEFVVSDLFCSGNRLNGIVQMAKSTKKNAFTRRNISGYVSSSSMRQCLNMIQHSTGHNEQLNTLLRKVIVGLLQAGHDMPPDIISQLVVMSKSDALRLSEVECILLLLSVPRHNQIAFGVDETMEPKPTNMFVSELLWCTFNQYHSRKTHTSNLWGICSSALKSFDSHSTAMREFVLAFLLHAMPAKEKYTSSHPYPPDAMFDLWALLANGDLNAKYALELCIRLEDCLAMLFEIDDGHGTWSVYQKVCSISPETFADHCFAVLLQREKSHVDCQCTLLPSVLKYDCSKFSRLTSLITSIGTNTIVKRLWESGRLDVITATFVLQACSQQGAHEISDSKCFSDAALVIGQRISTMLSKRNNLEAQMSLDLMLTVLKALCSKQLILHETQKMILEVFGHLEDGSMTMTMSQEVEMLKLALCVGTSQNREKLPVSLLLSKTLVRCCGILPKCIKKMIRTKQEEVCSLVDSTVHILTYLVENVHMLAEKVVTESSDVIDGCIIACLKYGMRGDSSDPTLGLRLAGCLKIVRIILLKSHTLGTSSSIVIGTISPSQVHAMAISHSSFPSLFSKKETTCVKTHGPIQQLELVRLLLCTLSLDSRRVRVESDIWTTLLQAYNASTNVADGLLRRLMFLYDKNDSCEEKVAMNDLRWGQLARIQLRTDDLPDTNYSDENWEWLIDALELDRVRSTLSQFPVTDTLEPALYDGIECATISSDEGNQDKLRQLDSDSQIDDDARNETDQPTNHIELISRSTEGNKTWLGSGEDHRYSPGFVLPLILTAMEAHSPSRSMAARTDESLTDGNSDKETVQSRLFASICRRLSDKGGIALAMASLSCRCPSLRKVAVSICGLFLKALQMQESHGVKSWHERPQQEMILSSLQRGLAVRRAIQMQKSEAQGEIELGNCEAIHHKYKVPMLPAVSAVFLAKSLLILSRPGEEMYGQINRYFLRLTDYHGAFQDCFGLPAFLSLYCSSSDELSHCRDERNWALLTLKESAVDEYCYRIISQHHVPELIMSSLDSLVTNPEMKGELYVAIDAIESLLLSGSLRASHHLIERQGLLSWLHGIISWREVSSVFPSDALKCKFLKFISTAVESYRNLTVVADNNSASALTFYEKVPLANAVVRLCLDGNDAMSGVIYSPHDSAAALLAATCDALWAIYSADKESQSTGASRQPLTKLNDATSILMKFIGDEMMFQKVLASICDLPLVVIDDSPPAEIFCEVALTFILEMKQRVPLDVIVLSLRRACELINHFPFLGNRDNMLAKMLKCRRLAVLTGGIKTWDQCVIPLIDEVQCVPVGP